MRKRAGVFLLLRIVAARIVLIDDISGIERHGDISIDSTRNGVDHIVQKIKRMKTDEALPYSQPLVQPIWSQKLQQKTLFLRPLPTIHRVRHTAKFKYILPPAAPQLPQDYPSPLPQRDYTAPPAYPPYALSSERHAEITEKIRGEKRRQEEKETLILELNGKENALNNSLSEIGKEQETVRYSIRLIRSEIESLQVELENLKTKLKDLVEKSESLESKKYRIKNTLQSVRKTLQESIQAKETHKSRISYLKKQYTNFNTFYIEGSPSRSVSGSALFER